MSEESNSSTLSDALDGAGSILEGAGDAMEGSSNQPVHAAGLMIKAIGESLQGQAAGLNIGTNPCNFALAGEIGGGLVGGALVIGLGGLAIAAFPEVALGLAVAAAANVGAAALLGAGVGIGEYIGSKVGGDIGHWAGGKLDQMFANPSICPLAIDLDGNGLDFINIETSHTYFDLDADGFAEHTAWLGSGDGFLVRDVNSNGRIDSISELFGSNTAADGFASLATLDSNTDGLVDASDTAFASLQVWRDLNGNGSADAGELTGLSASGIVSISLGTTAADQDINGVHVSATSTVTFTGSVQREIADAWLPNSQIDTGRADASSVVMVAAAYDIPMLRGYGNVEDLRAAVSEDSGLLAKAQDIVDARASYGGFSDFRADIQDLLLNWIGTADADPGSRGSHIEASHMDALEKLMGQVYDHAGSWPLADSGQALEAAWSDIVDQYALRFAVQLAHYDQFHDFSAAMQSLMEEAIADPTMSASDIDQAVADALGLIGAPASQGFLGGLASLDYDQSNDAIVGDVAGVAAALEAHGEDLFFNPPADGADTTAYAVDMDGTWRELVALVNSSDDPSFASIMTTVEGHFGSFHYQAPAAWIVGGASTDNLAGSSASEFIYGLEGNDTLAGGMGGDTYVYRAGDGDDRIMEDYDPWDRDNLVFGPGLNSTDVVLTRYQTDPNDLYISFAGHTGVVRVDSEFSGGGYGVETIQFADGVTWTASELEDRYLKSAQTAGDDLLLGAQGSTTIHIDALAGNDSLFEDSRTGETDTLAFGTGLNSTDVLVTRSGSSTDLTLAFSGHSGSLTLDREVEGYGYGVEQVQFGDGATWTVQDLEQAYLNQGQTAGDDHLYGFVGSTDLHVNSMVGDDTFLEGQASYDTDRLIFGAGFASTDVHVTRNPNDQASATLSFAGHAGTLTLQQEFAGYGYGVEQVLFSDGVIWTVQDLENRYFSDAQTAGDDTIFGFTGSTTIHVDGLSGHDTLWEDEAPWDTDTLVFGGDLNSTDVEISRDGGSNNVTLAFAGHSGAFTLGREFEGYGGGVEQVQFADGVTWSVADLEAAYLSQYQTSGNDQIWGFATATNFQVNDLAGDDTIYEATDPWDTDKLVLGPTLVSGDVSITRPSGDLNDATLTFAGHSGSITLDNEFSGWGAGVEEIDFGDGVVWSLSDLKAQYLAQVQTSGDDAIFGFGDATTFNINSVAGNDTIYETTDPWDTDKLVFGAGYDSTDVTVARASPGSDTVVLTFAGHSGSIILDHQLSGYGSGVEEIDFADGVSWTQSDLLNALAV